MKYPVRPINSNQVLSEPFTYTARFTDLLRSSSQTSAIQIHSDTDFEIHKMVANCCSDNTTIAANVTTDIFAGVHFPALYVLMTENTAEARLSDVATPLVNVFGTAQQPFILKQPKTLKANSVLSIQLSNLYTAQDIDIVELCFIGKKKSLRRGSDA